MTYTEYLELVGLLDESVMSTEQCEPGETIRIDCIPMAENAFKNATTLWIVVEKWRPWGIEDKDYFEKLYSFREVLGMVKFPKNALLDEILAWFKKESAIYGVIFTHDFDKSIAYLKKKGWGKCQQKDFME